MPQIILNYQVTTPNLILGASQEVYVGNLHILNSVLLERQLPQFTLVVSRDHF